MEAQALRAQAAADLERAVAFLTAEGHVAPGGLIVLGCSTSEVCGGRIGKQSDPEMGAALAEAFHRACAAHGVSGCVQCCEHLNRALVIERTQAELRGLEEVSAVPYPKAGGSCASAYYRMLRNPVLVESVQADAGLDVGDTLVGMHIRRVAVPLRAPFDCVGHAHLVMAYARPRLIGGARARYTLEP